jgi:sulfatase modifying factor 1
MKTLTTVLLLSVGLSSGAYGNSLVSIPTGEASILYLNKGKPLPVAAFRMQENPVSVSEFLGFLQKNQKWRRSFVANSLFADDSYLKSWKDDLSPGDERSNTPITEISWFAARAFCEERGLTLPTVIQWERASQAPLPGIDITKMILEWYGRPTDAKISPISSSPRNALGIRALHGLIWEWTEDFNSVFITGESRGDASLDKNMFCGAGSEGSGNPTDYAAFMRFAYRSSLKAKYTVKNLGFRCVKEGS